MTSYLLDIATYAVAVFCFGVGFQIFNRWWRERKQLKMRYEEKKQEQQAPNKVAV